MLTTSLFAANVGKYGNWPNSPQAYFMTKADRAEWSKVNSEADAEQFVNKFVASRGPNFAADVDAATRAADQHLTVAGKLGSRTLRGKIVILLGPPSSFSITEKKSRDHSLTPAGAVSGGGDIGGGGKTGNNNSGAIGLSPTDIANAATASDMTLRTVQIYTFTYAKDKLPNHASKDLTINVEVDPATGDDRITDTRTARQVDEILESAIETRATANPAR